MNTQNDVSTLIVSDVDNENVLFELYPLLIELEVSYSCENLDRMNAERYLLKGLRIMDKVQINLMFNLMKIEWKINKRCQIYSFFNITTAFKKLKFNGIS